MEKLVRIGSKLDENLEEMNETRWIWLKNWLGNGQKLAITRENGWKWMEIGLKLAKIGDNGEGGGEIG